MYELDLALIFGIVSVMLASIVIVEQQHLKRIIEHDKRDRTKKSASIVSFSVFKLLLELEQLNILETEEQEEINKMASEEGESLEAIEEHKNDTSGRLTKNFEYAKKS